MTKHKAILPVIAIVLATPFALQAQEILALEPAAFPAADLVTAVTRAPALTAARARVEAANARLGASGKFPDPTLEGMVSRRNTPTENMPMWEVTVRQPLPKSGERAADRERAQAVLAMASAEFAVMAGEMAADTAMALAEAATAQHRLDTLAAQIDRTVRVLSTIDARIATGQGRFGDRLALQTRIAGMQLMLERERRMNADALSEARGLLGLRPDIPLPAFAAPATADIDPEHAPALSVAEAKTAEARAMARMARASAKPMTAVGLRFEREQERMGNNDTVGLSFMTELPWRGRRYARAEERAAQAEATAALADADTTRYRIVAALSRVERAERLAEVSQRLAQETHRRLDAEYDTLVRSAGTSAMGNDSSVLMILEVLEKTTDAQLQAIDAEGSALVARAELWRYSPAHRFPSP